MPDHSGPKPYRTTAEGMVQFILPGGIKAVVSNNLIVMVAVFVITISGWSWVEKRLDQIWSTIDDVGKNKAAVEQIAVDVRIAKGEAEKRALQTDVDALRAELQAQRKLLAQLAACVKRRHRCTDLEVESNKDEDNGR